MFAVCALGQIIARRASCQSLREEAGIQARRPGPLFGAALHGRLNESPDLGKAAWPDLVDV